MLSLCTSHGNTFRIIPLLSIRTVFCISATVCFANSLSKNFPTSHVACPIPLPNAPITSRTTIISDPICLSRISKATCLYFVSFSCMHAMSQIQIFLVSLFSSIKCGLLDVFVFFRLNSKSQITLKFALFFSNLSTNSP